MLYGGHCYMNIYIALETIDWNETAGVKAGPMEIHISQLTTIFHSQIIMHITTALPYSIKNEIGFEKFSY